MAENKFEPKYRGGNPKPNRRIASSETPNQPSSAGMSRRDFLKEFVKGAGTVATLSSLGLLLPEKNREKLGLGKKIEQWMGEEEKEGDEGDAKKDQDRQQQEIFLEDVEVAGETIKQQIERGGEVVLDRSTKKAIYEKWKHNYSEGGHNRLGLKQAVARAKPWEQQMKEVFRKHGVPEEFCYLAIPESHFNMSAKSRKDARGPFQIIASTAKRYDSKISDLYDERLDPIFSAEVCAKHLKYSYEQFNCDWDLALADYNGAYTNKYALFRKEKKDRNYDDYLAWRQQRINDFLSQEHFEHEISEEDKNLLGICEKYDLKVEDLKRFNQMDSDLIRVGQTLKLPPTVGVKMYLLRDSMENLNYPEKFYAILDVIKSDRLFEKEPGKKFNFELVQVPKMKISNFEHVVEKGDGILAIARLFHSKAKKINPKVDFSVLAVQREIQSQNGIKNPRSIRPGQKIKVSLPVEQPASLAAFAQNKGIPKELLAKFNPAVISTKKPLPEGAKIRVMKM